MCVQPLGRCGLAAAAGRPLVCHHRHVRGLSQVSGSRFVCVRVCVCVCSDFWASNTVFLYPCHRPDVQVLPYEASLCSAWTPPPPPFTHTGSAKWASACWSRPHMGTCIYFITHARACAHTHTQVWRDGRVHAGRSHRPRQAGALPRAGPSAHLHLCDSEGAAAAGGAWGAAGGWLLLRENAVMYVV